MITHSEQRSQLLFSCPSGKASVNSSARCRELIGTCNIVTFCQPACASRMPLCLAAGSLAAAELISAVMLCFVILSSVLYSCMVGFLIGFWVTFYGFWVFVTAGTSCNAIH